MSRTYRNHARLELTPEWDVGEAADSLQIVHVQQHCTRPDAYNSLHRTGHTTAGAGAAAEERLQLEPRYQAIVAQRHAVH